MTDEEQIMINGIDVGECKFFNNITENHYCFGIPCKDRPNCYFKQLARKTQECEKLTNKNNSLTAELNQIKLLLEGKNTQYNVKVEECEELKRKLSNQEQLYQNEIEIYNESCLQLRQENDDLYLERLALNTANSGINSLLEIKEQENDRYREALEEIEEYIYNNTDFDINDSIQSKTAGYDILQIIKDVQKDD